MRVQKKTDDADSTCRAANCQFQVFQFHDQGKMNQVKGEFNDRWGIILASLGMAVGAGNLWRFPRLAGQYGGSFILLWFVFLIVWSIPLLLAEFSIGKKFKKGVIGSFGLVAGKKFAWMGFFIAVCTLGISFYYSVVVAWSIEYLAISVGHLISGLGQDKLAEDPGYLLGRWTSLSNGNYITLALYMAVVVAGVSVVGRGVNRGLERANKILIPCLFALLAAMAVFALMTEGGAKGLEYMFAIRWGSFKDPAIWIEALSQSAWSTGAGWGLMMTISSYTRKDEDVVLNTFVGAFGNNAASVLAGAAILPAVFALSASGQEAISFLQSGNQALTFVTVPRLLGSVPGGGALAVVFFLALAMAAFSSFLPMLELLKTNLMAFNFRNRTLNAVMIVAFCVFGYPSAYSLDFFSNQDWVWGLGLIINGMFVAYATACYGAGKFKKELIDKDSDFTVPGPLFKVFVFTNMVLGIVLIYWWMSREPWFNAEGGWNWHNAGAVAQWAALIVAGLLLNKFLCKKYGIEK